jgi:hypothetical protein
MQCMEGGSIWRVKGPDNALRLALKGE